MEDREREYALRLREEAERTLIKVEELWRVSSENERLKAENEAMKADQKRTAIETDLLQESLRSADTLVEKLQGDAVVAMRAVVELESALASFNRHSVGLGSPRSNHAGIPNRHRGESAAFRSESPRFGKPVELAMRGAKAAYNVAAAEERRRRYERHLHSRHPSSPGGKPRLHDLPLLPPSYADALTRVLAAGIDLGRVATHPPPSPPSPVHLI